MVFGLGVAWVAACHGKCTSGHGKRAANGGWRGWQGAAGWGAAGKGAGRASARINRSSRG